MKRAALGGIGGRQTVGAEAAAVSRRRRETERESSAMAFARSRSAFRFTAIRVSLPAVVRRCSDRRRVRVRVRETFSETRERRDLSVLGSRVCTLVYNSCVPFREFVCW